MVYEMSTWKARSGVMIALLVAVAVAAGCDGADDASPTTTTATTATTPATATTDADTSMDDEAAEDLTARAGTADEFAADKEARAQAEPDYSTTVFSSADEVQGREYPLFIDKEGYLTVTTYDDRRLTEEEKLQDPVLNPNWEPFAECVAGQGLEVRDDPTEPFMQAVLDRLIELVNEEGPFETATPRGLIYEGTENSDAFLQCAEGHLR